MKTERTASRAFRAFRAFRLSIVRRLLTSKPPAGSASPQSSRENLFLHISRSSQLGVRSVSYSDLPINGAAGVSAVWGEFHEMTRAVTQTDGLGWGCVAPSALFRRNKKMSARQRRSPPRQTNGQPQRGGRFPSPGDGDAMARCQISPQTADAPGAAMLGNLK